MNVSTTLRFIGILILSGWVAISAYSQDKIRVSDYDLVLDTPIEDLKFGNLTLQGVCSELSHAFGLSVCLEISDDFFGSPEDVGASFEGEGPTARFMLDYLVAVYPSYAWVYAGQNMVNVIPVSAYAEGQNQPRLDYDSGGVRPFREIMSEVFALSYSRGTSLRRVLQSVHIESEFELRVEDSTYLELLNKVFQKAGPEYNYTMSAEAITWGNIILTNTRPLALREARELASNYAAGENKPVDLDGVVDAYQTAIDSNPFGEMRAIIAAEFIEVCCNTLQRPDLARDILDNLVQTLSTCPPNVRSRAANARILDSVLAYARTTGSRMFALETIAKCESEREWSVVGPIYLNSIKIDAAVLNLSPEEAIQELNQLSVANPEDVDLQSMIDRRRSGFEKAWVQN